MRKYFSALKHSIDLLDIWNERDNMKYSDVECRLKFFNHICFVGEIPWIVCPLHNATETSSHRGFAKYSCIFSKIHSYHLGGEAVVLKAQFQSASQNMVSLLCFPHCEFNPRMQSESSSFFPSCRLSFGHILIAQFSCGNHCIRKHVKLVVVYFGVRFANRLFANGLPAKTISNFKFQHKKKRIKNKHETSALMIDQAKQQTLFNWFYLESCLIT